MVDQAIRARAAADTDPPPARRAGGRSRVRLDPRTVAAKRVRHRRRRTALVLLLLAAAALVGVDLARGGPLPATVVAPAAATVTSPVPSNPAPSPTVAAVAVPQKGADSFAYAGQGRPLGRAGTLHKYRVAVEDGAGVDVTDFAAEVDAILDDPRGWTAGRTLRLQRVAKRTAAEFTVYLATPATSQRMCRAGGLHTAGFASCRLKGKIVINLGRWLTAVPDYGAPLAVYQAYAVNHEIGHQLGRHHEACPGPGLPAPVMQQQTYGLQGCRANGWPYVAGRLYAGPAVP